MFFDRLVIHVDDECPEQYVKITLLKSLALCLFVNVFSTEMLTENMIWRQTLKQALKREALRCIFNHNFDFYIHLSRYISLNPILYSSINVYLIIYVHLSFFICNCNCTNPLYHVRSILRLLVTFFILCQYLHLF